jgi:peptide/nickel transport system ATP-binding protein
VGSAPLLSLRGLTVSYRRAGQYTIALAGADLDLPVGGRLALIGESGSGKSTLAMAVCGLLPDSAKLTGHITFPALPGSPVLGRDIGVLFQDPGGSLNPVLTIGEQIAEVLVVHRGIDWRAATAEAVRLLGRMQIPDPAGSVRAYAHQFSGGQRQRIALAAALAASPALLVADEPTSALDSVVQGELVRLLDALVREEGLSLLFISHDLALASNLADQVAVLRGGMLVEAGPVAAVLGAPAHAYTRALIASRLDLDTPRAARLAEIDPVDFSVIRPPGRAHG